jgi:transketolase
VRAGPANQNLKERSGMAATEQLVVTDKQLDLLCINTIRTLAIDAVQQANSGHPGAPMGLAPVAYGLWQEVLRFDPKHPHWLNRDRFVLSNGHASMLLYAILYLTEVRAVAANGEVLSELSIPLSEIKRFRQLGSRTPGHPESHLTTGVEATTGPLGQGVGNSLGMAVAERWLAANFNRPGFEIFNYNVYAICSDGDLMEGIGGEAASLAGHLGLSNLCWIYDNNHVTLDGPAVWSFSEDVATRFVGYQWNVTRVAGANDLEMIGRAFETFHKTTDRPTLIILDSHIGYGSPHKQDTNAAHGEPLGEEEVRLVKHNYGWPEDAKFLVPEGVLEHFREGIGKRGHDLQAEWATLYANYAKQFPDLAARLDLMQRGDLPAGWDKNFPVFPADPKGIATRESSAKVLNSYAQSVPWVVGGSADLATSNKTTLKFDGAGDFQAGSFAGRNFHFGIREHVMGASVNGMVLSGLRAFGATFFNFSDYMRASIRLAALSEIPSVFVFTHDSIGVGEDGPTHQPIEQLASLRAMPNLLVLRPGDANEAVECWRVIAKQKHRPSILALTRQAMPTLDRSKFAGASGTLKGAYVLSDAQGGKPDLILIGTGSEVSLCLDAAEKLKSEGTKVRVVSMPCWELFEEQDAAYRESVLPASVTARVSVEMASVFGWERYVGTRGRSVGMRSFGASAPLKDLLKHFGFTVEAVVAEAKKVLAAG